MAVIRDESFQQSMEISSRSLNPEAPEFFPSSYAPAAGYPLYQPNFFHYPALIPFNHPLTFSPPPFSHYQQHEVQVQPHFSIPDKAVVQVTKPLKAKKNLCGSKHHWKRDSYGKQGFVWDDQLADRSTRAVSMKEWRPIPAGSNSTVKNKRDDLDQATSFKCPRKVQACSADSNNREKHSLLPLKSDGNETTIMIKNIPIRYTREMLKDFLDQHCMLSNQEAKSQEEPSLSAFDFLYLPIDFRTKSNRGYAFVNFTNPVGARKFFDACQDQRWDYFKSSKIRQIYCAKLQGIEQLMKRFETMGFPCKDYQPLSFNPARDGSKQSVEESLIGRYTGPRCSTHSKSKCR